MKQQLNPGSYELMQEGSVRGYGYVVAETPDVTIQRWLLLADYIRPPKRRATFQPRADKWSTLEDWSNFVRAQWREGCQYAKAVCTAYSSITSVRNPNQQLDGNSNIARIGLREVAQIFTVEDPEDSDRMLEHWVLFDEYDAGVASGVSVEAPAKGVPGLNEFQQAWQAGWKSSYTYVIVDCRYYDELPAAL